MRLREVQRYPRQRVPANINSPLDLVQLEAVRRESNGPTTSLPYSAVGSDEFVDNWIIFGQATGLLDAEWAAQLDRLSELGRGPSNKLLLQNDAPKF